MIHSINLKKLVKPGDILLFRTTHNSSLSEKFIVWAQKTFYHVPKKARFCHVAMVDHDTDLMLEAVWPKTRLSKIASPGHKNHWKIEIYRIDGVTDEQVDKMIAWTHDHLDEWYNLSLFFTGWTDSRHAEVCSTYVSHACKAAKLYIPGKFKSTELVIPDDYYNDPRLKRIR